MDKIEKVKVLSELFDLINLYYVERDMPSEGYNFFTQLEKCCELLDVDFNEVKNVFQLNSNYLI